MDGTMFLEKIEVGKDLAAFVYGGLFPISNFE